MNKFGMKGFFKLVRLVVFNALLLTGLGLTGCAATQGTKLSSAEMEPFTPSPKGARLMDEVKVRWEVHANVSEFCGRAARMSGTQAFFTPPVACAMWNVSTRECVIITGPQTTHMALGHELRHCFEGNFHR